ESWEMLKIKRGGDIIDQIYYFKDKSERELGLRFEWTASLCRVVASHKELPMPFKRYVIGPVWRYEHPSEKRLREFWQADADIVGVGEAIADAEVLAVAVDGLKQIGFEDFKIRVNDRRVLEALLNIAGMPLGRSLEIFRAVDKIQKIGVEGVKEELKRLGSSEASVNRLLGLIKMKGRPDEVLEELERLVAGSPVGLIGLNSLKEIDKYSMLFGIEEHIQIDLSLARGLDYYTGPVFEIYAGGFEGYGSIAGGGRYDDLIKLFGGDQTPATGISLGIERILLLIEEMGKLRNLEFGPRIYVAPISPKVRPKAIEIAQLLRKEGFETDMDLMNRSLTKQLEHADRKGFSWVVIVGEREMAEGRVTLRCMRTGEQRSVKLVELPGQLKPPSSSP
ncbi:MAG: histidine--tRNA ligase, partial [Candidatus Bathyarchaeia archaeon]